MKIIEKMYGPVMEKGLIFLLTLLSLSGMVSCVTSLEQSEAEKESAVIHLSTPVVTRAVTDDDIDYFRIIMYKAGTKQLAYNLYYKMDTTARPVSIKVRLGVYDIVFVANEHNDPRLHGVLGNLPWNSGFSVIESEYFSSSSINSQSVIPMAGVARGANIKDEKTVEIGGQTIVGTWDISDYLYRLAVKVDLKLTAARPWYWEAMNGVRITRVPSKVYLFEEKAGGAKLYNDAEYESAYRFIPFSDMTTQLSGTNYIATKERIILPSSVFANKTDPDKALLFQVDLADVPLRSGTLGVDEPRDYTAPRNRHFSLNGTFDDDAVNFHIQIVDWNYYQTDM